jgi:hypothetical protein
MTYEEVVKILGYDSSPYWQNEQPINEAETHLFNLAKKAKVKGSYLFNTASAEQPPRLKTAVHVAIASSREKAREIHKNVWNLGDSPFLIVIIPQQEVRVYRAFSFTSENEQDDIIDICPDLDSVQNALKDFYAQCIDSGIIWSTRNNDVTIEKRVDRRLLRNLKGLSNSLLDRYGIESSLIHALLGKFLYLYYLRHRQILDDQWISDRNLDFSSSAGSDASLANFLKLVKAVEKRFNGQIFPLDSTMMAGLTDPIVNFIGRVFSGEESTGQLGFFREYDYQYIPVELLSAIYEQFLHDESPERPDGAFYTPEHLADYLIWELDASVPLKQGFRVLDPSCGSGVFLVLVYRRLIAIQRKRLRRRLTARELSVLLQKSIFGVERNVEACYVTEFSLILTLLSNLEPPELKNNETFKFPKLHNHQIFACDFFDTNSPFVLKRLKFDWVIGNPPWFGLKKEAEQDKLANTWINKARESGRPVDNRQVCEAFAWHVGDYVKKGGGASLILSATILTNDFALNFRREFFAKNTLLRVSNFSNLASILFESAAAPAISITFRPEISKEPYDFIHAGPQVIFQPARRGKRLWALACASEEIQRVGVAEIADGNKEIWKLALWGTHRDKQVLRQLNKILPNKLATIIHELNWVISSGTQLGVDKPGYLPLPEAAVVPGVDPNSVKQSGAMLTVPNECLYQIPKQARYYRERGGKGGMVTAKSPHMIIRHNFAPFSMRDFICPHGLIAISVPPKDELILRGLSLYFNSSIARYLLFFRSRWGVSREDIQQFEVQDTPVPKINELSELGKIHKLLEDLEIAGKLTQAIVDNYVEQLLRIHPAISIVARDFIEVKLLLNNEKLETIATSRPTKKQFTLYAKWLINSLEEFTGKKHSITIHSSPFITSCSVSLRKNGSDIGISYGDHNELDKARIILHGSESQWWYSYRSLRLFSKDSFKVYKRSMLIEWIPSQAMLDADDIIAEAMTL